MANDPGAVFEAEVVAALRTVRSGNPAAYQRYRKRIKDAAASVTELDRLVLAAAPGENSADGHRVLFPELDPWPEAVDGAALLDDLAKVAARYVGMAKADIRALALWVVFTYAIYHVSIAPYLAVTSPDKRCGKTTLLGLLARLVRRPLSTSNLTAAALFRSVDLWEPTLLIDESDTFLRNSDELRGVLNSGHTRLSAYVLRTTGDTHEPRRFSTWCAKAIAIIGELPGTLADRAIEIPLKRKLPGEKVESCATLLSHC